MIATHPVVTPATLADEFHRFASRMIDAEGISPFPCFSIGPDGKLIAGMVDPSMSVAEIYGHFWGLVAREQHQAAILGLDRSTRPGQGTEFADVLTCIHWWHDPAVNWGKSLRGGVINYRHEPRIVRPWDWDNAFWSQQMIGEAKSCAPPFRIDVKRA